MNDLELRQVLSIEVTVLEFWIEQDWLVPDTASGERRFRDADVARGRLILDLVQRMGVNAAGVDVVMDLVDQLHGVRGTMQELLTAIRTQDEATRTKILAQLNIMGKGRE
ncbi:MerR family transcriptional regulator [Agrobacterium rosae]|uniref:Chaperone modulator CbpM n=1 Tax=Agrobacterium rosae TaxID=1972867 RepID=A0AAW9FLD3_9HYPH|nr:chaperone modulator CbpM [Agrobacterium rosae]MDX8304402.1 chaperone modulator CbpM [Agrobacterium rosae]